MGKVIDLAEMRGDYIEEARLEYVGDMNEAFFQYVSCLEDKQSKTFQEAFEIVLRELLGSLQHQKPELIDINDEDLFEGDTFMKTLLRKLADERESDFRTNAQLTEILEDPYNED